MFMRDSFNKHLVDKIYAFRNVSSNAMPTPLGLNYTSLDVFLPRYGIRCLLPYLRNNSTLLWIIAINA